MYQVKQNSFKSLIIDTDITISNHKRIKAMTKGKVPDKESYALYDDLRWQERYTLILKDGSVYHFGRDTGINRIDGELNVNTPYPHLGLQIGVYDLKLRTKFEIDHIVSLILVACM